jgi:parallel beta-helix repeat protein
MNHKTDRGRGKMKKGMYFFTLGLLCIVLLVSAAFVGATTITSLPYEITTRGYYTINTNLTSSEDGIIVKANNVTIDLKGYTIEGSGTGSYRGIYMNGRNNVEIRDGTIRNFGLDGINEESSSGHSHRVINVRVIANGGSGIYLWGSNHLIEGCTASYNSVGDGIHSGHRGTISGNATYNNGNDGIHAYHGCTISNNTASFNADDGIQTEDYCTISNNTASFNADDGINAWRGCTISGNTAGNNGSDGIVTDVVSTVKNNTAYYNQQYGINLSFHNLVDGNAAYNNNQSGGAYTNLSSCGSCVFGINVE